MTSIGIGIGDTGPVFTRYRIDTKICSIAHPYFEPFYADLRSAETQCCFKRIILRTKYA